MNDVISREQALYALCAFCKSPCIKQPDNGLRCAQYYAIDSMPPAKQEENK